MSSEKLTIIDNKYGLLPEYISTTLSRKVTGNLGPTFNHIIPTGEMIKVSLACDVRTRQIVAADPWEWEDRVPQRRLWPGDRVKVHVRPERYGDSPIDLEGILETDASGYFWNENETSVFALRLDDGSIFKCCSNYVTVKRVASQH